MKKIIFLLIIVLFLSFPVQANLNLNYKTINLTNDINYDNVKINLNTNIDVFNIVYNLKFLSGKLNYSFDLPLNKNYISLDYKKTIFKNKELRKYTIKEKLEFKDYKNININYNNHLNKMYDLILRYNYQSYLFKNKKLNYIKSANIKSYYVGFNLKVNKNYNVKVLYSPFSEIKNLDQYKEKILKNVIGKSLIIKADYNYELKNNLDLNAAITYKNQSYKKYFDLESINYMLGLNYKF